MITTTQTRTTARSRRAGRLTKRLAIGMLASAAVASVPASASAVEITNARSGLKADVIWGSTADYTGVFLWRNNTSLAQEFDFLSSGNGYYRIRARHSNKCLMLDWRQGAFGNGTKVIQYNYCTAGYAPADWQLRSVPGTTAVKLVNRQTGRCLDTENGLGGTPPERALLQQWDCVNSATLWNSGNQLWRVA